MLAFFISFFIALIAAPLIIRLYLRFRWVDDPKQAPHAKKTHSIPIPRGGGIVVFIAILLSSVLFLTFDSYLIAILVGAAILALVGIVDDIYDINPYIRIGTGLLAALVVIGAGIGIAYVTNPFGEGVIHLNQPQISLFIFGKLRNIWLLSDLFALVFILWNMNSINWAKGVDGQLPGFVTASSIVIALLSLRFQDDPTQFNTTLLSLIVAGAFLGLLFWNFFPQRMMPGYGGGSLAGYFLSILAILSGAKLATTLMVLAIPTADGLFTIARRILAGKSPFWGDRGHLHHKLMDTFGWGKRRVAIFYWASSLGLGLFSLLLSSRGKIITFLTVVAFVFGFMVWAKMKTLTRDAASGKS